MNKIEKSEAIKKFTEKQVNNFFPNRKPYILDSNVAKIAFLRTTTCISSIKNWSKEGFDFWISWQYSTYLYFLSREIWLQKSNTESATKIFLLNKALNSIELYYKVEMPNNFFLSHTLGVVFAQAKYGNYCVFHQGCTVGRNGDDRPRLGEGIVLYPNSSIIGRCNVRENTVIAPGVQLVNQDTPGNCYVFMGAKGKPIFKEIDEYFVDRIFDRSIELK